MAKDIKDLPDDLQKVFDEMLGEKELQIIANWIRDTIYKRTKSGKGLDKENRAVGGATNAPLKPLSDSYIKQRKGELGFFTTKTGAVRPVTAESPKEWQDRFLKKPKLGKYGKADRSNLTLTGELLESIKASVENGRVIVEIPDMPHGSGLNMRQLLDFVEEVRPFFGLSETERKTLDSMIGRMIRDKIRKANQK